jgi:Spy/CpxP family protein refolding chaperone
MKQASWMAAAIGVVMLGVVPAHADRGGPGEGMGGPGMGRMFRPEIIDGLAAELGVPEGVIKQIKDKAYKADQEAIKLRADLDSARLEMRRLMEEEKPDQAKVLKQVEIAGGLETELQKNRIRLLLSVRELLTPEQRRKLQQVMVERKGRRGMGRDGDDNDERGMGPGMQRRVRDGRE